jgi:hypothetical protein
MRRKLLRVIRFIVLPPCLLRAASALSTNSVTRLATQQPPRPTTASPTTVITNHRHQRLPTNALPSILQSILQSILPTPSCHARSQCHAPNSVLPTPSSHPSAQRRPPNAINPDEKMNTTDSNSE